MLQVAVPKCCFIEQTDATRNFRLAFLDYGALVRKAIGEDGDVFVDFVRGIDRGRPAKK